MPRPAARLLTFVEQVISLPSAFGLNVERRGPQSHLPNLVFICERNVTLSRQLIWQTRHPLDNRGGRSPVEVEQELTHSTTAELSVTHTQRLDAGLSAAIVPIVKAQLSMRLGATSAQQAGETLTRTVKVRMKARPGARVVYEVQWIQIARSGECVFSVNGSEQTFAYQLVCGLESHVDAVDA
jgi:hypothetical protein